MKKILSLTLTALILVSCGGKQTDTSSVEAIIESGDLDRMKTKQTKVLAQYDSIAKVMKRLQTAIAEQDTTKKYNLVTTYKVTDTTFKSYLALQGNVETQENILVYPEYQGVLTHVYIRQGQYVNRGQVLAKIDDGGLSSQLAQLETQYDLAKTTYDRQQRLWEQNIGSEIQYLQAKTNMESTESAVKQLRSQLGKTTVTAPFSGVVDDIITEQGQVVSPGMSAILRLVSLNNMYVKASVPENYLQSVKKGSAVTIAFPALGETVEGKVRTVGNFINPSNRTFDVEIDVPNKNKTIKPNLIANLKINNYSKKNTLVIPSNSIQENAQGDKYVYVLTDSINDTSKTVKTKIETGKIENGLVEVLSGLENGSYIVKDGALTLKDGETVSISSPNPSL